VSAADRLGFAARRALSLAWPWAAVAGAVWLLALGRFATPGNWRLAEGTTLAALAAVLFVRGRARWRLRFRSRRARRHRLEIEVGLALLALCEATIQATGGARSALEPLLYLVVALLVFFHRRAVGLSLAVAALGLDLGLAWAHGDLGDPAIWVRATFLCVFAALAHGLLALDALRRRRESARRLESEIRALYDEARDYRMISTALGPESRVRSRAEEEEKRLQAAACAVRDSIFHVLELVHCALRPHTAILLWLDPDGSVLKVKELITDSDRIAEHPLRAGEGVLGGILKRMAPVNLANLRDAGRLPYYSGPVEVRSFLGVPVVEGSVARGILAVDRKDARPFDETDELLLGHAARQVMRAIESERLLARVDQAKQVQERFYAASESFREARSLDDVYRVTCQAAHEVVPWDFAALTGFVEGRHAIVRVVGDGRERLEGRALGDGNSLCAMAVKNRHELPIHGDAPGRDVAVFSPKLRLRGYESILVLPLVARAEVLGTLVLAAKRRGAFSTEAREMLRVIASQAAGSIEHAMAYARLETLATTDGLTGLLNHRNLQERLDEMLARADRHERKVCLILTDIDHFKAINDTYGHPVGDMVLREVAAILAASVRKIDLVARYGGEEFALVLDGTDAEGGAGLAERVRSEVASRLFRCDSGNFRVTLSLGVAVYPEDARQKQVLVDRADQALYAAKRAGRNRTVVASGRNAARGEGAA
jgi:diguanylate cyclase (GGDEF)-like protein